MISISIRKEIIYIIAVIIAIIYIMVILTKRNTHKIEMKDIWRISMFLYFIGVIGITLFPIAIPPATEPYKIDFVNLDITKLFQYGTVKAALINIGGNILLFVPLIPLLQLNFTKKKLTVLKAVSISLCFSFIIEGLQYLENIMAISDFPIRITDISDLVLNLIGGMIGYIIIIIWNHYKKSTNEKYFRRCTTKPKK